MLSLRSFLTPARVLTCQQRFAGHSKWQNIRHTKAANDMAKGQRIAKICNEIRRVAAGSPDPKINDALRGVIERALKSQVPRSTIDRQLELVKNVKIKKQTLELLGPGRSFILVNIETDNISRTRRDMKKVFKKAPGVAFMKEGAAKHSFTERGVISIGKKDKAGNAIDKDRAEEIAIITGAEEVEEEEVDEGDTESVPSWTLYTSPDQLPIVKSKIEKMEDIEVLEADVKFLPVVYVPLSPTDLDTAATLCAALQELEEVTHVFDNIKAAES